MNGLNVKGTAILWRVYLACGCNTVGRYRPVRSNPAVCHQHGETFVTAALRPHQNGS